MPQFKKRTHRAKQRLEIASPRFRWIFTACDNARLNQEINWESHVFCATDAIENSAVNELKKAGVFNQFNALTTDEKISMFSSGLMWSAWRMSQGIYRFDQTLYDAVISTDKMGNIPTQILRRLPEWCVYIQTPGLFCDLNEKKHELHGVWACFALNYNHEVLTIHVDIDDDNPPMPLCFHINTSESTLNMSIKNALENSIIKNLDQWLPKVLNLLLYLCADSEITHKNKLISPENPVPKKTKKGWRLFEAKGLTAWDVGVRMGAALRKVEQFADNNSKEETSRSVRPHIRRAHWRTIISGKMKNEKGEAIPAQKRKRELRWLPPTSVNLDEIELPAVIRRVL